MKGSEKSCSKEKKAPSSTLGVRASTCETAGDIIQCTAVGREKLGGFAFGDGEIGRILTLVME